MMVSANSAICVPPEPSVAGPSALKKRFTSSSSTKARNFGSTLLRRASAATAIACMQPEMSTPQAAAWPAVGKYAASASVAIIATLSRIGAAAALAKRCSALRMPP
jgi:hypothetical protein